jgi:hypothetical protein
MHTQLWSPAQLSTSPQQFALLHAVQAESPAAGAHRGLPALLLADDALDDEDELDDDAPQAERQWSVVQVTKALVVGS